MEYRFEPNRGVRPPEVREETFDREITVDAVLPDYCDDVSRIVRVDAHPSVRSKHAGALGARVEGSVTVCVIYVSDPGGALKSMSFTSDFEHAFERSEGLDGTLRAEAEVTGLNCRLLNPRKLSVRIELSGRVRSYLVRESMAPSHAGEGDGVEFLRQRAGMYSVLCGEGSSRMEESLTVPGDMPAVGEIIYASATLCTDDVKPLYDKAVVKFTANLKLVYSAADAPGDIRVLERRVPSTQIVDVSGLDEDHQCTCRLSLTSQKASVAADPYGENRMISVELAVASDLCAFRNSEVEFVRDAYSTKFESHVTSDAFEARRFVCAVRERRDVEDGIMLEDAGVAAALDTAGVFVLSGSSVSGRALTVEGNAEMSVTVRLEGGELQSLDCTIPIRLDFPVPEIMGAGSADIHARIVEASSSVASGRLTVRLSVACEAAVFDSETVPAVREITYDTDRLRVRRTDVQTLIYYPEPGESMWAVAKRYGVEASRVTRHESRVPGGAGIVVIPL